MQLETIKDVLQWTARFHRHLSECMSHCAEGQKSERARLLLTYLSQHELKLSSLMDAHVTALPSTVLDTWVYEYLNKTPGSLHSVCEEPFSGLTTMEIIAELEQRHAEVIALYSTLREQVPTPLASAVFEELLQLQQKEVQQMVHSANRLEDL